MKNITQLHRLIIALIYFALTFLISYLLFGSILPPDTEKGVWFFTCLASVILGELITNPYFTAPADSISNTTVVLISLSAVNPLVTNQDSSSVLFWWFVFLLNLIILVLSCINIASNHFKNYSCSQIIYKIISKIGNHRVIFSSVVLYALYAFHFDNPKELYFIGLVSTLIIIIHPVENLWLSIQNIVKDIHLNIPEIIGEVVGHEFPDILKVKILPDASLTFGDLIAFKGENGVVQVGCVLSQIGFTGEIWYRVLANRNLKISNHNFIKPYTKQIDYSVIKIESDKINDQELNNFVKMVKNELLGTVAPKSDINKIIIEIAKTDIDIREGSLVETCVGSKKVLYQIINGLTKKEIIEQKNSRGFVHAEARKLGLWNENTFEPVNWLPLSNAPVRIINFAEQDFNISNVGYLPKTNFHVSIDVNTLVTHNTAILGILGVGKTFLALELIERMIREKIKVICLDLTDEYERELDIYFKVENAKKELNLLNEIGKKGDKNPKMNEAEGGSVQEYRENLKTNIETFLKEKDDMLRIYNPASLTAWKQSGKLYNGKAPFSMLTPCEITRIISEVTLEILQEMGPSDVARCCLVYEEAHSLVPEWNSVAYEGDKNATNGTAKAILQGRKYGLGCLLITQRTANVTKSILNQCNTVFAMRTIDEKGIEFVKYFAGNAYTDILTSLQDQHALVFGKASSSKVPVVINLNNREKFLEKFREGNAPEYNIDPFYTGDDFDIDTDYASNYDIPPF